MSAPTAVQTCPSTPVVFNSMLAGYALSLAYEHGVLEEIHNTASLDVRDFCRSRRLKVNVITRALHALACFDIVELAEDCNTARPGRAFQAAFDHKGYFLWLVRGSGGLLHGAADCVSLESAGMRDSILLRRDGASIACASRDYGRRYVDPHFYSLLATVSPRTIADLGCGSGDRLIQLIRNQKVTRGVGIDINPSAVAVAKQSVASHRLQLQIEIVEGDVRALEMTPALESADLVTTFFMGHDLWPANCCLSTLENWRRAFPNARDLFLCDTYRSEAPPSPETPIFTLGFEFLHAVMDCYVPSYQEWLDLFRKSPWRLTGFHPVDIAFSGIFHLQPCN